MLTMKTRLLAIEVVQKVHYCISLSISIWLALTLFLQPAKAQSAANCAANSLIPVFSSEGWYNTVTPFEHSDSGRTQLFQQTCPVGQTALNVRVAPERYPKLYNVVTRANDELFAYGGEVGIAPGAYVAKLDPLTLNEQWRVHLYQPGQWSYPGVVAVHRNGFVYAIAGTLLAKIDPITGQMVQLQLPGTTSSTVYNGFDIIDSGLIIAKSMDRGQCNVDGTAALRCVAESKLPADVVVVDPTTMRIRAHTLTSEPVLGRITVETRQGVSYIYCVGINRLFRYRYINNSLSLDPVWGPVYYRAAGQQPGTGAGLLGEFVVVQTNFLPAKQPLSISAVNVFDSHEVYSIQPFAAFAQSTKTVQSLNPSKPALDPANQMIFTNDSYLGLAAALKLSNSGFEMVWLREHNTYSFGTLIADEARRQLILPDYRLDIGDTIVVLNAKTGAVVNRSLGLDPEPSPGAIVAPGFNGEYYYVSASGTLIELSEAMLKLR
jgi:hypothetical protein